MGTWGFETFENDDAADWMGTFCSDPNRRLLVDALSAVTDHRGYIEAPPCCEALAAAEIIAAKRGFGKIPSDWASDVNDLEIPSDDLLQSLAIRAIDRIVDKSELKELWEEAGSTADWRRSVDDLRNRLTKK